MCGGHRTQRFKHGISDGDMLHALRNPVRVENLDEGFTMFIGPARDGVLLEIGVVDGDSGPVIIHPTGRVASTCHVEGDR
jgi:hypothetical protein